MIVDVPSPEDFADAGLGYFNLAWDDAVGLYLQSQGWEEHREFVDPEEDPRYDPVVEHWKRAKRRLATCALLVHQGTEFLLKAQIAAVSPFLLLDSPDFWPGRTDQQNTPFSDIRTIDAQYLPKLYDTVALHKLSTRFKTAFTEMRKRRNTIAHSHVSVVPQSMSIVRDILLAVTELAGEHKWPSLRREYELGHPNAVWDEYGETSLQLNHEFFVVISELSPSECRDFLGFPKKQRRYFCPYCRAGDLPTEWQLAVLAPSNPGSRTLTCIACGGSSAVERNPCTNSECKSDVVFEEECMTCGHQQSNGD